MKRQYLIVVILVLVVGVIVFITARPNNNSQDTIDIAGENEVFYTNSGFSPKTLTVNTGTTVTFANKTERPMWVASNPHPVHTDFSAFDQKRRGDTYSFTFNESGTYVLHNHLFPTQGGTIIVE